MATSDRHRRAWEVVGYHDQLLMESTFVIERGSLVVIVLHEADLSPHTLRSGVGRICAHRISSSQRAGSVCESLVGWSPKVWK